MDKLILYKTVSMFQFIQVIFKKHFLLVSKNFNIMDTFPVS